MPSRFAEDALAQQTGAGRGREPAIREPIETGAGSSE